MPIRDDPVQPPQQRRKTQHEFAFDRRLDIVVGDDRGLRSRDSPGYLPNRPRRLIAVLQSRSDAGLTENATSLTAANDISILRALEEAGVEDRACG